MARKWLRPGPARPDRVEPPDYRRTVAHLASTRCSPTPASPYLARPPPEFDGGIVRSDAFRPVARLQPPGMTRRGPSPGTRLVQITHKCPGACHPIEAQRKTRDVDGQELDNQSKGERCSPLMGAPLCESPSTGSIDVGAMGDTRLIRRHPPKAIRDRWPPALLKCPTAQRPTRLRVRPRSPRGR